MGYVLIVPIAWAAGLAVYVLACLLFFGQAVSSGDLLAVVFWSAVAFCLCVPTVSYPALFGLRRAQGGCERLAPFALLPVALSIVPVVLIALTWAGSLVAVLSPEGFLFFCQFAGAGVVLGLGFAYVSNWELS